jgi:peptide/nickel transport system permease protein
MPFAKYVLRRAVSSIVSILGVLFLVFLISRVFIPNPARAWAGQRADEATVRNIAERYHLYDPLYVQFFYYLRDLMHGDLGTSPTSGQPVLTMLQIYFPATLELTIVTMAIALSVGILSGVISAIKQDKPSDHSIRVIALLGLASPPFLVALLIQLVFFFWLGIFPDSGGRISRSINPPLHLTGLYIFDSLVTGNWLAFVSSIQHILMPAVAGAIMYFGIATRLTRASMLEVMGMDYVRMARAKGLTRNTVIFKHALRNALIPTVTVMTVMFAYMLGGSVVVETIFQWPGIGRYAAQALFTLDYPAVTGVTLIFAICVIVTNFASDILYVYMDPRLQLE